jgi:dihydroorotate dehydrogenase electron transfer subunit
MLELAKQLRNSSSVVLGYRDFPFLKEEFVKTGSSVYVATEDGSMGTKGNVIGAIMENNLGADVIFACGPTPMLRAVKKFAQVRKIKCYISMEERMACGVGACLGCVVETVDVDDHSKVHNARVCKDGPVFDAEEVNI